MASVNSVSDTVRLRVADFVGVVTAIEAKVSGMRIKDMCNRSMAGKFGTLL